MSMIKREYQWKKFGLNYGYPDRFLWSQWQLKPRTTTCYLIYRWLFACFFLSTTAYVLSTEPFDTTHPDSQKHYQGSEYLARWPAYLTNWGYILIDLTGLSAAILVTCRYVKEHKKEGSEIHPCKMCGIFKVYWALHTMSIVTSIGITITYWISVYSPKEPITDHSTIKHIMNSICMITDFFIVSHPFRILHFYLPVLFVVVYLAFTVIYFEAGGLSAARRVYLYRILDWRSPAHALINCFFGLLFLVFLHHVVFAMYLLRRWLHLKWIVPKNVDPILFCNSMTEINSVSL